MKAKRRKLSIVMHEEPRSSGHQEDAACDRLERQNVCNNFDRGLPEVQHSREAGMATHVSDLETEKLQENSIDGEELLKGSHGAKKLEESSLDGKKLHGGSLAE